LIECRPVDVDAYGMSSGQAVTGVEPVGEFGEAQPEQQDYLEVIPNRQTCHFV
jgi:peptide methionine sulfoxide reductase MsrA